MQLSLPVPAFPTPAVPSANAGKNSAAPAASGTPADPAVASTDSFDSFFQKDIPADKSASEETDPNTEQAAAVMAATFWMPIAPVVSAPQLPSALLDSAPVGNTASPGCADPSTAAGAGTETQGAKPFFALTSSRALTSFAPVKTAAGSFDQTVVSAEAAATSAALPDSQAAGKPAQPAGAEGNVSAAMAAGANETAVTAVITPMLQKRFGGPVPKVSADTVKNTAQTEAGDSSDPLNAVVQELFSSDVEKKATAAVPAAIEVVKEKIASLSPLLDEAAKNLKEGAERYFLDPIQKAVTTAAASVGISVAKVNAAMSAAAPVRTKSASTTESTTSFVYSAEATPVATLTVDAPAPVATVRETMAAVISAVDALERRADVQQKSVDLQFNVGSEKLGLRVELRDGTVHTTFRTESAEMNGALAREWHSVVQPGLAREIRLAEPVFSSASTTGNAVPAASSDSAATAFGNSAQQQQREQQKAPPTFASALKHEFYDSAVPESAPATSPATNSSQLLNALA